MALNQAFWVSLTPDKLNTGVGAGDGDGEIGAGAAGAGGCQRRTPRHPGQGHPGLHRGPQAGLTALSPSF